jgi:hypothetical protein
LCWWEGPSYLRQQFDRNGLGGRKGFHEDDAAQLNHCLVRQPDRIAWAHHSGVFSHHLDGNDGRIGLSILNTAAGKIRPDMVTLFFKGILCNVLVCGAVWLAYAGRSVTDKIIALILPVSAFIAAGFEHCVANMYFLPLAWLLVQTGETGSPRCAGSPIYDRPRGRSDYRARLQGND